jgi:hypothetical protein
MFTHGSDKSCKPCFKVGVANCVARAPINQFSRLVGRLRGHRVVQVVQGMPEQTQDELPCIIHENRQYEVQKRQ